MAEPPGGVGFFGGAIRRPVTLAMALLTLLVMGLIAYARIPVQLVPSGFENPRIWVWIPTGSAGAREGEERVARPIEEELRTLAGIERVTSRSREGLVSLEVRFDPNLELALAKAEVRDRIERVRPRLPADVDRISFWSEDADQMPLAWFGILHPGDSDRTDFLLQQIVVPRLEALPGISKVDVFGDLADSVRILLDEERVIAAGVNLGDVIGRLSREAGTDPLGEIDEGGRRFLLRADLRPGDLEALERYPVRRGLTLGDLGEVIRAKSVRQELARIDGAYAYFAVARREAQSNVVEASRALHVALEELSRDPRLAGELSFLPFFVQGDMIEGSLDQLQSTALWGGALAVLVLLLFLRRLRLTLCVAASIPISALIAVTFEYFRGTSFNILTMTGITLALGMLVDNSVVMVENIARLHAEGLSKRRAAEQGARQIALAVTLATLTTVVVFLPLIFMGDDPMTAVLLGGIGIPLCTALLASLMVAVVFLPAVAARSMGERPAWAVATTRRLEPLGRVPVRIVAALLRLASALLRAARRAAHGLARLALALLAPRGRWLGTLGILVRLGAAAGLVFLALRLGPLLSEGDVLLSGLPGSPAQAANTPGTLVGFAAAIGFLLVILPPWLRSRLGPAPARSVPAATPPDSLVELIAGSLGSLGRWSLAHRGRAALLAVLALMSVAIPFSNLQFSVFEMEGDTDSVRYRVRFTSDFTLREAAEQIAIHEEFLERTKSDLGFAHWMTRFDERGGNISMFWNEPLPPSRQKELARRVRDSVPRPPGHGLRFAEGASDGPSRQLLHFHIYGPDSRELERLLTEAKPLLERVPGLGTVRSQLEEAPLEVLLRVDRDMALMLGVDSESAFRTIAWTLRGWPLPRFWDQDREVPLIIEYDQERAAGFDTLRDLSIWGPAGPVALSSFMDFELEPGSRETVRVGGRTTVHLEAEIEDPSRALELTAAGYRALSQLDLPRGFGLGSEDGLLVRQATEQSTLLGALALSVVLVFLLMAILFESVALPFSVLTTVPFAFLGAFWVIFATGTPMDAMAWIGLILLAGVVVNNGIVLIDRIHRLRAEGLPRAEALELGIRQRVRPVLMTASTTVFGLLPMILSEPATDSVDYRGLATIVAGGLAASTFFTLWVVPLAYTWIEDLVESLTTAVRAPWARLAAARSSGQSTAAPRG